MKKIENGVWEISNTVAEVLGVDNERAGDHEFTVTRAAMHLGGRPDWRARNEAIAATFDRGRAATQLANDAFRGMKVTLLTIASSGGVYAREGTLVTYQDRPFLLNKGSRTKGHWADRLDVLELTLGYSMQAAVEMSWNVAAARVPEVAKVTAESVADIPEYDPDEENRRVHAVFLGTHPGFGGGRVPSCLWLITDKQSPEEPGDYTILNGYLWAPATGEIESEHGSIYLHDLERWGGRVTGYTPGSLTFAECWNLPGEATEVYERILSGQAVPA